ncbi:MAG: fumarate hydratase [Erysipelotrichaceae bacterium]|jgi:fumarate hydratase subunit alpha|nr:fumarate hydratase [Erysipelotrichaceae bacterium]MCI1327231.1 fumarate hydratase [Solobacterium sp.]MCH4044656.1 fumarate hydratase [Erysipelotrichaceae bacterium]MCH4121868.1 fumarate hydratase [Erysipelotrichaceae bacterium]MCI1363948.1 fumarate hydratase [Solobacterium sp.]
MREIEAAQLVPLISDACGHMAVYYQPDVYQSLKDARSQETGISAQVMDILLENADVAVREHLPICQDTGLVTAYVTLGQDIHINGSLVENIQKGVSQGYTKNHLRASAVDDPLFARHNTGDNTPAIIYTNVVEGDTFQIDLMAKGFGSENMSALKMLKPAEGLDGVKQFVLDTIKAAGPNACPPMVVGVGIGGTFDYSAYLAKKALLRPLSQSNPDPHYADLEQQLLREANKLNIGPMGLHGHTTVLKVQTEYYPTHIAGLPCAVNICCHACRHERIVL